MKISEIPNQFLWEPLWHQEPKIKVYKNFAKITPVKEGVF